MTGDRRYEVELLRHAEKDLDALKGHRDAAVRELLKLESDPWRGEPLKGSLKGARKLRFSLKGGGSYRAVYTILDDDRVCIVFLVGSRENVYDVAQRRWNSLKKRL